MSRRTPAIEFVTADKRAAELFPPRPAVQATPEWWRRSPTQMAAEFCRHPHLRLRGQATIKACPAIQDYLGLGYVVSLWTDFIVNLQEDGFCWETPEHRDVGDFPLNQWAQCPHPEGEATRALKLHSPWEVVTPPGWSTLIVPTWYHRDERFEAMPAVLSTDRYSPLIPVFTWKAPLGEACLLKAGTPLFQVYPFPRSRRLDLRVTVDVQRHNDLLDTAVTHVRNRLATGAYREGRRQA